MDAMKTGKIISERRKELGLTQKTLSEKLFISDKAISKWERGLCFPDISILIPLTEILQISLYDLLKGEKSEMYKNDVEQILKDTVTHSANVNKKIKKKYIITSSIIMCAVIILSVIAVGVVKRKTEISAIVKGDTVYGIEFYSAFTDNSEETIGHSQENIIGLLPLKWKERKFVIDNNAYEIDYNAKYDEIKKAYGDEQYVKSAIIDMAAVLFTTEKGVETVKIRFTDYSYSVKRDVLLKALGAKDYFSLADKKEWERIVDKKLANDEFVETTFGLFQKNKVTKEELSLKGNTGKETKK